MVENGWIRAGATVALLAAMPSGPSVAQGTAKLEQKLDALESEVRELKNEILARRAADNAERRRKVAAAAAVEVGDKPGTWKIPGTRTSMQIGGFVRFDGIYDFTAGGVGLDTVNAALARSGTGTGSYSSFFNPFCPVFSPACPPVETAAIGALNGGNFRFHARLSRIWVKTWTPTDWGELHTNIAADFLDTSESASGVFRLRQAYGQLGPVLAGVTESTFRPTFAEAETLDFGGSVGYAAVRKAQIRYTHAFGPDIKASIALEEPFDSIGDADIPYSVELNSLGTARRVAAQRMPDIAGSLSYRFPQGQIWIGGVLRLIEQDSGGEPYSFSGSTIFGDDFRSSADKKLGWGISVAGTYDITPQFTIGGSGFVGRGIGSYVGIQGDQSGGSFAAARNTSTGPVGNVAGQFITPASAFHDALILGPNEIRTILSYGGFAWARYLITNTVRTNFVFGYANQQIEAALPYAQGGLVQFANGAARKNYLTGNIHYMWSMAANLIWSPVPQVDFGIEYIYLYANRFTGDHPIFFFANNQSSTVNRLLFVAMYRF